LLKILKNDDEKISK